MYTWDSYTETEYSYHIFLENKMEKQHQETIQKLSTIVRLDMVEDFAKILAAAYDNEAEEAFKVADTLDLDQSNFLAVIGDFAAYKVFHDEKRYQGDYDE